MKCQSWFKSKPNIKLDRFLSTLVCTINPAIMSFHLVMLPKNSSIIQLIVVISLVCTSSSSSTFVHWVIRGTRRWEGPYWHEISKKALFCSELLPPSITQAFPVFNFLIAAVTSILNIWSSSSNDIMWSMFTLWSWFKLCSNGWNLTGTKCLFHDKTSYQNIGNTVGDKNTL